MESTDHLDRLSSLEARVEALEVQLATQTQELAALRRRKAPAAKVSPSDFLARKISEGHLGTEFSGADIAIQRWPHLKDAGDVYVALRTLARLEPPPIAQVQGSTDRYAVCVELPPRPLTVAKRS